LAEWQDAQLDLQLERSLNSLGSPLCGTWWSTVFAARVLPFCSQYQHSGCALRCSLRATLHAWPYPRSR